MAEVLRVYSRFEDSLKILGALNRRVVHQGRRTEAEAGSWEPHAATARLTMAQIRTLEAEYGAGVSSNFLSERYGLSANAVLELVRRAGIPVRHGRISSEMLTTMVALREGGMSYREIGERFDVSRHAVAARLKGQAQGSP